MRVAEGWIATGGKVEVTLCMTGVTRPSGWVDEDSLTITVGGGVVKDVMVVVTVAVSDVTGGGGGKAVVESPRLESLVGAQEVPKSVVTSEEVIGTVTVTVSTEVETSPSIVSS